MHPREGREVVARLRARELSAHWRGHVFQFGKVLVVRYDEATGTRLLAAAILVEGVRIGAVRWLAFAVPLWILSPLLVGFAFMAIRGVARVKWSQIGFHPWREWTVTEKSYFVQVLIIANVVFPVVLAAPLRARWAQPSVAWTVFVPYLFFGFYQEVVYRGLFQTELVRRWGAPVGILLANALYTFGPLHWYYFASGLSVAVPMFASIFAIGLFFGVLLRRSDNLWMVAIFHGIGNAYTVGSLGAVH